MRMTGLDGKEFSFRSLAGKWVMVSASPADCTEPCQSALLQMRQQRLMTGKEQERVERVWLVTDDAPLSTTVPRDYGGTHIVRAPAGAVREFLPLDGADAPDGIVWLVDPMGNLMLRWPRDPEPQKVKKDLARLLTASSHWVRVERKD
jgi:peroxiredoxin